MFNLTKCDKANGASTKNVCDAWWKELENDGYKVSRERSFIVGDRAGLKENQFSPTMETLHFAQKEDRVAVLLFGWYHLKKQGDKWQVHRTGGHFVALAGHDTEKKDTFYVTNPLVDYKHPDKRWYSKIEVEEIALTDKVLKGDHDLKPHMLLSRDLVGGHAAILEDVIVVSPE
jgi:hypothetical protein